MSRLCKLFCLTILLLVVSNLSAQTSNQMIEKLKSLNQELDKFQRNKKRENEINTTSSSIRNLKNQIHKIKKELSTVSGELDKPIFSRNNIKLDYNIDLLDFYMYKDSDNYYQVHARIKNKDKRYLEFVKLRANFYSEGVFTGTDYSYIDFETYGYSGISPYKESFIETYYEKFEFDSVEFQIDYRVEDGDDYIHWDQILKLESVVIKPTGVYNKWQGVVNNNYNYSMRFPKIFACIYKNNKMLCCDYTYLDVSNDSLAANSTGVFDSYIDLPSDYDEIKYYLSYSLYSLEGSGNLPPNKPIL